MSECNKYQFRQPVEVFLDGEWHKAVYDAHDPGSSFCHLVRWYAPGDKESRAKYLFDGIVRPDPDFALVPTATPRTGWRLPEPGDVIRVMDARSSWAGREVKVNRFDPEDSYPVKCFDGESNNGFAFYQVQLVRLHDAPLSEPPPDAEPVPCKPRSNKQGIIDNATLELAAVALEQHGQDRIAAMVRDLQRDWSDAS